MNVSEICQKLDKMTFQTADSEKINSLVDELYSAAQTMSFDEQRMVFISAMKNYFTFNQLLTRDMSKLPQVLRYAFLSKTLYGEGSVDCPSDFAEELEQLLDCDDTSWYDNSEVGYRIYNLRESVLSNPSVDVIILNDEFENSGDEGNLIAILKNPNCPDALVQQILNREHFIFEEMDESDLTELIEVAQHHKKQP